MKWQATLLFVSLLTGNYFPLKMVEVGVNNAITSIFLLQNLPFLNLVGIDPFMNLKGIEKFSDNPKLAGFQRVSFDFLSNPGLWLLRKSKEILWKPANFGVFGKFSKKSKYTKRKSIYFHPKQLPRGPQPLFFLKSRHQ